MTENSAYVGAIHDFEGVWNLHLDGEADSISRHRERFLSTLERVFVCLESIYTPTSIRARVIVYADGVEIGDIDKGNPEKTHRTKKIESDEGFDAHEIKSFLESVLSEDLSSVVYSVETDGRTEFILPDDVVTIGQDKTDQYKLLKAGDVVGTPQYSPFRVEMFYRRPDARNDPDSIAVKIHTETDLWFQVTELGEKNRERVRNAFSCIDGECEIQDYEFGSSLFGTWSIINRHFDLVEVMPDQISDRFDWEG
ncbi:hypothetical protein [Haloarchaeobius sp. DFWS5]|uniref:hypothetical protein n=1 Tax=Haloarchaeobius sp. DFWS5 TaxID=3446114 RepID=UPI003EBFED28